MSTTIPSATPWTFGLGHLAVGDGCDRCDRCDLLHHWLFAFDNLTSLDSAWMLSACVTVLAGLSLFFVTLPGVIELSGGAQPVSLFIARVSVAGCDGTC